MSKHLRVTFKLYIVWLFCVLVIQVVPVLHSGSFQPRLLLVGWCYCVGPEPPDWGGDDWSIDPRFTSGDSEAHRFGVLDLTFKTSQRLWNNTPNCNTPTSTQHLATGCKSGFRIHSWRWKTGDWRAGVCCNFLKERGIFWVGTEKFQGICMHLSLSYDGWYPNFPGCKGMNTSKCVFFLICSPYHPCIVYFPTFTIKINQMWGKYTSPMDPHL